MTYRLDEIKDFLFDEDGQLNEDLYDELYDLFCSKWSSKISLSLPEFELDGKKYPSKNFNFTKTAEEVMDDYCEGKTQYHYNIKLIDNDTGQKYQIYTYYFNDSQEGIDLEYVESKKINGQLIEQCCDNMSLVSVSGKCNDMFSYKRQEDSQWIEGSPSELNLGKSDYIQFTYCTSCNKIHFK